MRKALLFGLVIVSSAHAQSMTTGAIAGRVTEKGTDEPLAGVTVTIGSQIAITDGDGVYKITDLLPGTYDVELAFDTATAVRSGIIVGANALTTVNQELAIGEAIHIDGSPPPIRIDSTAKEKRIDRVQIESLPVPGDSFEGQVGTVPGAQNDGAGVAISGSSGLENRYLVDGTDITGLTIGDVGTPVMNEFIDEIAVVSGGYNAEYGRATGGIVNIITRRGTDELRGSVFGTIKPGFLTAATVGAPKNASTFDVTADTAYSGHLGFELGGPIIKKKLWFYVGAAPSASRTDIRRTIKSQTDCRVRLPDGKLSPCDPNNADSEPDIDPDTGFYITDTVESETRRATTRSAQIIGKLNYAVSADHQAQLGVIAQPSSSKSPGILGPVGSGTRSSGLTTDTMARWSSKLDDGKSEIEAIASWHRSTTNSGAYDPALDRTPRQIFVGGDVPHLAPFGGISQEAVAACDDRSATDPYPFITNCPNDAGTYSIGGPGPLQRDTESRFAVRVNAVRRFKAFGNHQLKGGLDLEDNRKTTARAYSGGALLTNYGTLVDVYRWAEVAPPSSTDPIYDQTCTTPDINGVDGTRSFRCRYLQGIDDPHALVGGETVNWGAFLQDSWQPHRTLVLNAGLRYEEQRLRYASELRGTVDALTGNRLGTTALSLRNNWSPRLGAIWDPTAQGRSKIYASWGRFFEAIPMDINDRSFGGELSSHQSFSATSCGPVDPATGFVDGNQCLTGGVRPDSEELIGSQGVLVAPGLKAQFMDETLLGAEVALPSDFVVGLVAQHRTLGRVIEDVSTDGANTYIIANPGEWSREAEQDLEHQIMTATDKSVRTRLERDLARYRGVRRFDKPSRDYTAIELSVSRRFQSGLYLAASYTYSHTTGNYPGLVSYDNGQIDPNISSQYDLIELLANRQGKLPQDRPHYIKLDAYRGFEVGGGVLTLGTRVRALSGIPKNALAAHYLYGSDESMLLPRGSLGRTDFDHGVDLHVGYKKQLHDGVVAELFVDVFNVYNRQGTFRIDETYAPQLSVAQGGAGGYEQNVNPISGGTMEDLVFAKALDTDGNETSQPVGRNPNFGRTTARYAPASAQVGFRVTF
jgi:outer membrane receptor protein involved in Fe transport